MSFRLCIDKIENRGSETIITGRLIDGAYFGPQSIRLTDMTGTVHTASILTHGLIDPKGWPVTAEHDTQLQLYIATPAAPFTIDPKCPIEGVGHVAPRRDSIDLSKELVNPLLWGSFSALHMTSEAIECPYEDFLGLSRDEVNGYYNDFLSPLVDSPTWPIFPLEIDSDRYVEIEWAGGSEYQDRVWIGSTVSGRPALLGYDSGHFSLPGLRPSELVWLLDRLDQKKVHPASGLLLLPMCFLPKPDIPLTKRLAELCARVPGARSQLAETMATNMIEHLVVPDA